MNNKGSLGSDNKSNSDEFTGDDVCKTPAIDGVTGTCLGVRYTPIGGKTEKG